jgi:SAM-dependent methyltransferase
MNKAKDCPEALSKIGNGGQGIEREVRFGKFQGNRFIPGVSKRQYESILKLFSDWTIKKTSDKIISRTYNQTQSIRKISNSNGKETYQLKEKISIVDVPTEGIRLSKAKEKSSSIFKNVYNGIPANKNYKQTRNRTTFIKDDIQIDVTHLPENKLSPFQVEIEYKSTSDVCKYVNLIKNNLKNIQIQGMVFSQYRDLVKSPRFAGPLPQTLTLEAFKKKVLTKTDYSVTEKADGERYLLFIDNVGGFNLISRKMEIQRIKNINPKPELARTIIDGEFVNGVFYSFDMLFLKGRDIRDKKLRERLTTLFGQLVKLRHSKIKMKSFFLDIGEKIIQIPSNRNTGAKNIYDAAGKIWSKKNVFPYSLDGLIFTPMDEPYMNRKIYKWKDENTIDFYYNKNKLFLAGNKSNGSYGILPFSGIDGKGTFMSKGKSVKNLIFEDETIPSNLRRGLLEKDIPGNPMVGEFKFHDNTFKLIRKRPDKELPNGIDASNQSWEAITNPLTAEMISRGPRTMRDFHSEIKAKLIMKYAKGKSVLDIGSGKGEDVGKYVKANSKPVVGFDLVKEEYPHPNYMTFHKMNNPVYRVKNYINKNQKFDVININFAIHYFLANKKLFESLVVNIHENLKSGGILMATVLDGSLIYKNLKNKNKVSTNVVNFTKKYNNSLNFNSPKFKFLGQKVDVLVKGTKYFGNKSITEFLFNFNKFLSVMEQLGFEFVEMKSFSDLCDDSIWCRRYMSQNEKDYSFKNIYFILKKK